MTLPSSSGGMDARARRSGAAINWATLQETQEFGMVSPEFHGMVSPEFQEFGMVSPEFPGMVSPEFPGISPWRLSDP